MKKIWYTFLIAGTMSLTSCLDDITSINKNPKSYTKVPGETLFSNAQFDLTNNIVNGVNFKLYAQQWAETTYPGASQYSLLDIGNVFWAGMYRDVLRDLKEAADLIGAETLGYPEIRTNKLAIVEILSVYTYSILVNTYGNIPYTEALDPDNLHPAYDDAKTIYLDLFDRLDNALGSFDYTYPSLGSADIIYGGDLDAWNKFGNSLRLKMALTLADEDPTLAQAEAEKAFNGGLMESNLDNALFEYLTITPNTNPIWVQLIQSGREDFVASNTLVDMMKSIDPADARLGAYFNKDGSGQYTGGTYGASNNYKTFSHVSDKVTATDFPGVLMDYSEVEFYLAEAVERGYSVGPETAEDHYNNAIRASFEYWGASTTDADNYIANAKVAYTTATGNYKQKIGTQKYIAMYNRGLEAWTEYRRLDYPVLNIPDRVLGDEPVRYTYPVLEQNTNKENYDAAAAAIGGDLVTTKVFWDKF